jgi:hypothetical protein
MRTKPIVPTLLVLALTLIPTQVAQAAVPTNDDFAVATTVTEPLPFNDFVDTTDATTSATDPQPSCADATHTVWYSFRPSSDTIVRFDVLPDDNFPSLPNLSVWTGTEGTLSEIACDSNPFFIPSVQFLAVSTETYFVMVGSAGSGGGLDFGAEPIRIASLSLDPKGSVIPRTGVATVHGQVVCSPGPPIAVSVAATISQRIGRTIVTGSSADFFSIQCSSDAATWSFTVKPFNGLFVAGRAQVDVVAESGSGVESAGVAGTVKLLGTRH